jgi:hypothetical protein
VDTNLNARHYILMSRRRFGQGIVLAIILVSIIVLLLDLAQSSSTSGKLCAPRLADLKLPMDFSRWLGCALAMHETLAGGLIGAAGALFAAWLAWQAIMRQINAQADQAYEALQVELEPVVDMLNQYWRVVDASIKNKNLHPRPSDLQRAVNEDLSTRLDPVRHRQFKKLMESLSWIAQRMDRTHPNIRHSEACTQAGLQILYSVYRICAALGPTDVRNVLMDLNRRRLCWHLRRRPPRSVVGEAAISTRRSKATQRQPASQAPEKLGDFHLSGSLPARRRA